jgi:2-dehydropantoate 2-reductase
MTQPLKVLIVGAGAIGVLFGARLAMAGHKVTLVGREPLRNAVERDGLTLVTDGQTTTTRTLSVVTRTAAAFAGTQPYDWIFLTPKAYALRRAALELCEASQGLPGHPLRVVTIQNGVGNEEVAADLLGQNAVVAATVTIPIEAEHAARYTTRSKGGIGLARWTTSSPDPAPLAEALRAAALRTVVYDDARAMKWSKLLLNVIGNATSAILSWPPGRTMADSRLYNVELDALTEARRVMRAQGIATVNLPAYPARAQFSLLERLPRSFTRPILQRMVSNGRGGKMPSLYLSLEGGYRDSEVDVLNGAIVAAGAAIGIPTPINEALTHIVRDLARSVQERSHYRHNPDALLAAIERAKQQTPAHLRTNQNG